MSYLENKFKGKYRILAEYDHFTNEYPRELNGALSDNDLYIKCYKDVKIYYYGKGILEAYVPSLKRGNNILKLIEEDNNSKLVIKVEQNDLDTIISFKADDMDIMEKYFKPTSSGASIPAHSPKNLTHTKYDIPKEELVDYNELLKKLDSLLSINPLTIAFLKTINKRKGAYEKLRKTIQATGLKNKDWIYANGYWNNYIKYLKENIV